MTMIDCVNNKHIQINDILVYWETEKDDSSSQSSQSSQSYVIYENKMINGIDTTPISLILIILKESKRSIKLYNDLLLVISNREEIIKIINQFKSSPPPPIQSNLLNDIKFRLNLKNYYLDFVDGIRSRETILKSLSTIVFLYFSCLLPSIAFGDLHRDNTDSMFSVGKTIVSQGAGGMVFALLSGQPMVILLSTAPLAIMIKITYSISLDNNLDFWSFYALIGLFNGLFLIAYSIFGLSRLMKYSSRFIEETFSTFITIAFLYDGIKPIIILFLNYLYQCDNNCEPIIPIFTLLLSLLTVWICVKLANFKYSIYFNRSLRQLISDYGLFIGVILITTIRHSIFLPLNNNQIPKIVDSDINDIIHLPSGFGQLPSWSWVLALVLGFLLSLLYFIDQNISSSLASQKKHGLKKWNGMHLDLLIVGIINIILSFIGLPWVHGALPHSSLHVRALATIIKNEKEEESFIYVQETRVAAFLSHVCIFVSLFFTNSVLTLIPVSVLYGVFWFLGIGALIDN
ncbi:Sodium bicarbonate transporter-like protein 11 [Cavenderia fasciculata]|uniref:Sodium bicarbonate transporter-like protein 11 n=1 Tax=Cavenderia fasciculata TaxID=261658 RepID=F4PPW3_CACFS|nr:Sodium bicarbonate transporter-like protein 11 [Cavenderia fasciculata]EGG22426.1 Sodium bicarbonate transporter-like protein 11 [Cavenderia fasciculata]|eukprot:XP_004360277.1 Sodium bicarbonate transporter-like protein 11 [Cavenderia fasciculata]